MALPKKGTRLIEVDGVTYRWLVRRSPTYSQANAWTPMTISVELGLEPQQTLVVEMSNSRPDNWVDSSGSQVTPAQVEELIRKGLAQGWHPSTPGPSYVLRTA